MRPMAKFKYHGRGMYKMGALREKEYKEIQQELDECKDPLYFFHDDPDGLCSFLLFYRYKREGHGIVVKSTPKIDDKFISKVREYKPDKIFVLDIAEITQEFIDSVKVPIIWLDHHGPYDRKGVRYYNPRLHDRSNNPPVAYMSYHVVKEKEDLWLSLVGMVGDWFLPKGKEREMLSESYPDLLPKDIKRPEDALFTTTAGKLSEIFTFILKGTYREAMKYVKVLTRIRHYDEILKQETSQGRYIWKKYEKVKEGYDEILKDAKSKATKSRLLLYTYTEDKTSYTGELSNELLYRYPEKVILIARQKSGEMKCSLRSSHLNLPSMLDACLNGLEGYGGGHEHAAGCVVAEKDWSIFLKRLRKYIKEN